jgi:hypothetical protein
MMGRIGMIRYFGMIGMIRYFGMIGMIDESCQSYKFIPGSFWRYLFIQRLSL